MEQFDFISYMKDCATRLKVIGHSEDAPKFFRISGLAELEEYLQSLSNAQYPALLVQDNQDGSIGDFSRSDNYLDKPYYVFYIIDHPELGNADSQEAAKKNCKAIGKKILSRMRRNKRLQQNGLDFLDFSSVPYQTIGPVGDSAVGVMFSFSVTNSDDLTYNSEDWNE